MIDTKLECVILAAGSSKRLGQEKALVSMGSGSLISWISRRVKKKGMSPVIVTKSEIFDEVCRESPDCKVILNPDPSRGRTGSLQEGISALDIDSDMDYRMLVIPVDRPGFSDSTLDLLVESKNSCCPMQNGKGGHPILLISEDVQRVREASEDTPLRDIVKPQRFEVEDSFLHLNIDTPSDIELLEEMHSNYQDNSDFGG